MAILAIGATIVYRRNHDLMKQRDGVAESRSKMELPLAPP